MKSFCTAMKTKGQSVFKKTQQTLKQGMKALLQIHS